MTRPPKPASELSRATRVGVVSISSAERGILNLSFSRFIGRLECFHEARVVIVIYPPWLPGLSFCNDVRTRWCGLRGAARYECLRFYTPRVKLTLSISFDL